MTITYRDSAPASALSEFEERCEAFKTRLQSEDFLHNRGLGNEVGIYRFAMIRGSRRRRGAFWTG